MKKTHITQAYCIRSTTTGEYRVIAPCDAREHSDDHTKFTPDPSQAAVVCSDDAPDESWLAQRNLELVAAL